MPRLRSSLLAPLLLITVACPATPAPTQDNADEQSKPAQQEPVRSSKAPDSSSRRSAPEFILAPETGDVVELVLAELERARVDDRRLLVYVGASWCEPCQYFHAAVEDGTLDDSLAGVRLLEFDLDRDRDRLVAAGYSSRMIPLFVVPRADGRAGPRRTEGGVKGSAAVDNLRERLVALLHAAEADEGELSSAR